MNMVQRLQHKYALSRQGAVDMVKGSVSVTVTNIVLMMTAGILYTLIKDLLENNLNKGRIPFYIAGSAIVIVMVFITNFIQFINPINSFMRARHSLGPIQPRE